MSVGIESINPYVGQTYIGVPEIFAVRGLDDSRMANLMMREKSVNLPWEDPITNAVNAAAPLLAAMSEEEQRDFEAVIVGTESGIDFGKPMSTYVHHHLGLPRYVRSFEVKHACYGGTAALSSAVGMVSTSPNPRAKALVIATDAASVAARNTYWEPSQGAGAVAMVISRSPEILALDPGANGFYSYEVMDTCRPRADLEAGDSDMSLLSYLHCLEQCFSRYQQRVETADFRQTFDYLAFHTPFAGMVKGAHRTLMRKHGHRAAEVIDDDFQRRLAPSTEYCTRIGNVYSAALYLSLCSLIDRGDFTSPRRVGLFSYGSGCASEFYSGVVPTTAAPALRRLGVGSAIASRRRLEMEEYEVIVDACMEWKCGVRDKTMDRGAAASIYEEKFAGARLLTLTGVQQFHREYDWS
ncbi:MAG: hydroxymethylglutaryl-CoA synthase [Myxococcota bacterium]